MRLRYLPPAAFVVVGLLQVAAVPASATAIDPQTESGGPASPYAVYTAEAAQRFLIPGAWIEAVLRAESAGNPRAVSPAGAMGLMQVMPGTWAGLRARYRLGADPFEPRDNILAGTAYLREMLDRYGDVGAMLAAYNAGPDRVDDHLALGRPLPAETRAYVATISAALGVAPRPGVTVRHQPAPDWRAAPLFAARIGDVVDEAPQFGHHGEEAADLGADRATGDMDSAELSPSGGLFVARAEGKARR